MGIGELRIHGVGGPSAPSVLGLDDDAPTEVVWRHREPGDPRSASRASLRSATSDGPCVYHWAELTSGSRWFALWPLLLPFTLVNVAGWMEPARPSRPGRLRARLRRGAYRISVLVVGLAVSGQAAAWAVVGAETIVGDGGWRTGASATAAATVLVAAMVIARLAWRGFESVSPLHQDRGRWLWGCGGLRSHGFVRARPSTLMWVHGIAALATVVAAVAVDVASGWTLEAAGGAAVMGWGAVAWAGLTGMLASGTRCSGVARGWRGVPGFAAAAVGLTLLSGTAASLIGREASAADPTVGRAWVLVDLYGISLLVGLGVLVAVAVTSLARPAPGEAAARGAGLVDSARARLHLRLPNLVGALVAGLTATALTFHLLAPVLVAERAAPRSVRTWLCPGAAAPTAEGSAVVGLRHGWDEACARWLANPDPSAWRMDRTPPVSIAGWTFLGVLGVVLLNLVKSRANPAALRRVGTIWDVLTFWPRRIHPWAVRPYSERAVPELQRLLVRGEAGPPGLVIAHSQGSVLAAAALAPFGSSPGEVTTGHLVTMGSPLRSLYMQAFPAWCDQALLDAVDASVGGRWKSCFTFTDQVGRTVFVDADRWRPDQPGRDHALADPARRGGPVRGHSGYWTDERFLAWARAAGEDEGGPRP